MHRKISTFAALASAIIFTAAAPVTALAATGSNAPRASHAVDTKGASNISGWAVVEADGSLARGSNAKGSSKVADGSYEVNFNSKLKSCVFNATLGNSSDGNPSHGTIVVANRAGDIRSVFVETRDVAGTLTDLSFHLNVTC